MNNIDGGNVAGGTENTANRPTLIDAKMFQNYFMVNNDKDLTARLKIDLNGMLKCIKPDENDQLHEELDAITTEKLLELLKSRGIVFGIDEQAVAGILQNKIYDDYVEVAHGIEPVDGVDGYIIEKYERERSIKPQVLENGETNFKELGLLLDIEKGTKICDIVPPVPAVSGTGVSGKELKGVEGRTPALPAGKNISVTGDGAHLVAQTSGNLVFNKGQFNVENELIINGDVDVSVGNINFSGDVTINGDVRFGYTISSKKNVTITGAVEGASIFADGNIKLSNGINGQQKSKVFAKGNIQALYIESCDLSAEGNVVAESIVNSEVSSGKAVTVTAGRGVIAGGHISAVESISAGTIGSIANIHTTLRLGVVKLVEKKIAELTQSVAEMEEEAVLIDKNIQYLEYLESINDISPDRKALLLRLRTKRPTMKLMLQRVTKSLEEQKAIGSDLSKCFIKIEKTSFPPVHVHFGNNHNRMFEEGTDRCTIRLLEGDILVIST